MMNEMKWKHRREESGYHAWLSYNKALPSAQLEQYKQWGGIIVALGEQETIQTASAELKLGLEAMLDHTVSAAAEQGQRHIALGTFEALQVRYQGLFNDKDIQAAGAEGFAIRTSHAHSTLAIGAASPVGVLYGVFHLLRLIGTGAAIDELDLISAPANGLRMINHWDNFDGSIERGYAGNSFLYRNNRFTEDQERLRDYARMLASIGMNAIAINNVNVHQEETLFITPTYLPQVAKLADLFRAYGIRLYLSINFASPMQIGGLRTADPLDSEVQAWWSNKASEIYAAIPDFGGFLVKADSENRPGPFTYGRDHAEGANMLAQALEPYGGIVIWRCFVYNCKQDWRDRTTDRARAAYDHFKPLDGRFNDNVVLQIKNGPLDFQVREPVSPLFGALEHTNQLIEFQITQEYTGQQRHLCYLVPQWKEILEFNTYAGGKQAPVKHVVDGSLWGNRINGMAAVTNVGEDSNWSGHLLAQANLYGYGRLAWNPELTAEQIASEWIQLVISLDPAIHDVVSGMLMNSWSIYESYTAPLGIGWMVNPNHHYGPNVDGYEYSPWGTYHFADNKGLGVDRTVQTGTGYSAQYMGANADIYNSLEQCPDELLLFFHHVPYTHVLHSGKTVIQHIYDTHFEGAERAAQLLTAWSSLQGRIEQGLFLQVEERLREQARHAEEWRDQINTYFWRKSGIEDEKHRHFF